MADDERRAELEAVARALAGDDQGPWYAFEEDAEKAIAALDRVRDARGDDEGLCPECQLPKRDGEHQMGCSRSPQGEDHEAGIEAATHVLHGYVWHERLSEVARATVAAYLSRVSPCRDGTVAVEDVVRRIVARLRDHGPVGQVPDIPVTYGAFFADLIEREFSPTSTGDRK